jgi:outer membrane protein assembly factor BamB
LIAADGTVFYGAEDVGLQAVYTCGNGPFWSVAWEGIVGDIAIANGLLWCPCGVGLDATGAGVTELMGAPQFDALAVDANGVLYFISPYSTVVSAFVGSAAKWVFDASPDATSDYPQFTSLALGPDSTVYAPNSDGHLWAVSSSGSLLWKFAPAVPSASSPPAVDANGTVYFGSDDHNVYAVDRTGKLVWTVATGDVVRSSPAIGADGTLYIGSNDGFVYAIGP